MVYLQRLDEIRSESAGDGGTSYWSALVSSTVDEPRFEETHSTVTHGLPVASSWRAGFVSAGTAADGPPAGSGSGSGSGGGGGGGGE